MIRCMEIRSSSTTIALISGGRGDPHAVRESARPSDPRTPSVFRSVTTNIDNGLYHTEAHVRLNAVTVNGIDETNAGPFVENRLYWTRWLR